MEHNIQIDLLLRQTSNKEKEEGRKVDHVIEIKEIKSQDSSRSQTNKSVNQIFGERFRHLDKSSMESTTIFKVTVGLRESNPEAYKPKLISIGPYHKHNPELSSMEKYKLRYLQRFLRRKGGIDVESCIREMDKLKDEALKCYDDIADLDRDILVNFSEMLLLDGCFVVEYIREYQRMKPKGEDMIMSPGCIDNQVHRDLLLVENQLPFFILTKLHDMTKEDGISLTKLAQITFLPQLPKRPPASIEETDEGNEDNIKHLLHLVHMSCHPSSKHNPSTKASEVKKTWDKVMPNVMELSEAGVSFVKAGYICGWFGKEELAEDTSLFDIKFDNGVMRIPCFEVADGTETLLRNLIAYEQQSPNVARYVTDFATFMDCLIDSDKDVNLLRRKRIMKNLLGDDKEVASIFNKIGQGVEISGDNFYYKEECRKAVQHCAKGWNRIRANLNHNFFSSPSTKASTGGAVFLLILTFIQTVRAFY